MYLRTRLMLRMSDDSLIGGSLFDFMIFVSGPVFTATPTTQSTLRTVVPRM